MINENEPARRPDLKPGQVDRKSLRDGFLLLASVPYDEIGVDRARAEMKSRFLSRFAADVVSEEFPELAGRMTTRTAVLDWRSRNLELMGD